MSERYGAYSAEVESFLNKVLQDFDDGKEEAFVHILSPYADIVSSMLSATLVEDGYSIASVERFDDVGAISMIVRKE